MYFFSFIYKTRYVLAVLAISISSATMGPLMAFGQFAQPGNNVSLHISPEVPAPEERVSASVSGFGVDLGRASITWFVGGRQVVSGIGETSISFTAPSLGESTAVRVVVNTNTTGSVEKSSTITPSQVDILWEVIDGYSPPFYKGRTLPASQSAVRITAVPHVLGGGVASNMVYKWKRNFRYRDFNDLSGYGARTITYRKNMLEDTDRITVEISSLNGNARGASTVVIPAFTPGVLFYEDHPLYGTQYNRAFDDRFTLAAQESTVVVEPYFFSVKDPEELSYVWKVRGEEIPTEGEERANELTLRRGGGSGEISFSLSINHPAHILQLLNASLNVVFGEEAGAQRSPFSL